MFIMLSVVAGVRVGALVSGIKYPSGRWAGLGGVASVTLPFAVLIVVLTLAIGPFLVGDLRLIDASGDTQHA